ncbi:uncharacterized protein LOC106152958 [Lingula anatina]|uniref:Uncharacterized protein LOC106152958 n=1 Tax=Lingula anatina TaxID=7574 RepID=A0A1S3H850_LINAN|nr:uncharacterized protein LOC106152958 [Lingula anatina]|eukprot:XP_013382157.1 uncharacterized protein LOC106152958 [Lingula anatina]
MLSTTDFPLFKKGENLYYVGKDGNQQRVILDLEEVKDILHEYHSSATGGHSGINATLTKIRAHFMWSRMKEDVMEYIQACDKCQKQSHIKTQSPELKPITVTEAMELVGMDLIGPLPTTQNGHKWGAPKRLLSDQGREFVAAINMEMCKALNISRSVTSAYHRQTNGLDERTNQTLKARLSKLMDATDRVEEQVVIEEQIDEMVQQRAALMEVTKKAVDENVEKAKTRQRETYAKRKAKGVKTFQLELKPHLESHLHKKPKLDVAVDIVTPSEPDHSTEPVEEPPLLLGDEPLPEHFVDGPELEDYSAPKPDAKLVIGDNTLEMGDLRTLDGKEWLNDNVVHGYLGLIAQQASWADKTPTYVFPCFLATLWEKNHFDHWLYQDVQFSKYKYILLPACLGQHWILLVADVQKCSFSVLDSLGTPRAQQLEQNWLRFWEIRQKKVPRDITEDWVSAGMKSNEQVGCSDCGVFVLMNAETVIKGADLNSINQSLCQPFRTYAKKRLLRDARKSEERICDIPFCKNDNYHKWIQCNVCTSWCHTVCANVKATKKNLQKLVFVCPMCIGKN